MKRWLLVTTSTYPRHKSDTLPPFVHELCQRLSSCFRVCVLAPHTAGSRTIEQLDGVCVVRYRYAPARFETLAYHGGMLSNLRAPWRLLLLPAFLLAQLVMLRVLVHRLNPVAVHAHWLVPQGTVARLARISRRCKVIITSHGGDAFALNSRMGKAIKAYSAGSADMITAVSNAVRKQLLSVAGKTPIEIAPMGVDLQQHFVPAALPRAENELLYVGRLAEKKGVAILLRAFAQVVKARPHMRLKIVGDGPLRKELRSLSSQLNIDSHVQFIGSVGQDELPSHYQRATALVFPSVIAASGDQEGLGLVPIEAMGCECPVIASNLPAVQDSVVDRENGLLVPPGDVTALAQAIGTLLDNAELRAQLGRQARQTAMAKFDWKVVVERHLQLIGDNRNAC